MPSPQTASSGSLPHPDDREEFRRSVQRQSVAMGSDPDVFKQSVDLVVSLDRYDYTYLWSWMGAPIIQMPADVMATQEVIWATKPDVIIETGVARGGSVLFMASLLEMIGHGTVIGVDIDVRAHNRDTIETHPMAKRVVLIEGGSTDESTLRSVRAHIPEGARVMAVLDSNHTRDHVLAECRAYGALVTPGCYLVVADTIVGHLTSETTPTKRSRILNPGDEPRAAVRDYLAETDRFEIDQVLNGKLVVSSSPGGYLLCKS